MDGNLPITLVYWLIALFPLALLLVLLVWAKWSAPQAGAMGFLAAILTAMAFFRAPLNTVANAAGRGVWDAIFILYVIWPALLLYQVTKRAGGFEAMRAGIQKHTDNRLILVLAFGWVFASFLQGIAGFGAPIAVVAPLLVGLGVRPVMAVVIPLIGHAWANMFGTLAVSWLATNVIVDLENPAQTAWLTAWMLWIVNLLSGFTIAWLFGRWQAVKAAFWAILVISAIHGGGQLLLMRVNPTLSNFIPSTVALGALFLLMRWKRYQERSIEESPIMETEGEGGRAEEEAGMSLNEAFVPYYALIAISLVVLVIPAVNEYLGRFGVGLPFPGTQTGFGVTESAEAPYSPFDIFTHPGTLLIVASLIGYFWFKARGHYEENALGEIVRGMVENAIPASVAVLGFLTMSRLLDLSGQVTVLALGIAQVSPPAVYAAMATLIGVLGAFMTSSNTASNVLFSPLHDQTAAAIPALEQSQVIASQSAGGAIGNAIAPANVVLGTGTAGITGKEGEVLRYTLVYSVIATILVGLLGVVFYYAY